jgi:alkylhydroperoxidase/carboxymuconolactone decarboxylase family protein YurZ
MATKNVATNASVPELPANPWGVVFRQAERVGPTGAALLLRVGTNPWTSGVLPPKEVELIYLGLTCACTNLDEEATRRQIHAALDAGATRDEILLVLKCGVGLAVHSCSLGAPILLEEMKAAGVKAAGGSKPATPACDTMRAIG